MDVNERIEAKLDVILMCLQNIPQWDGVCNGGAINYELGKRGLPCISEMVNGKRWNKGIKEMRSKEG